MLVISKYLLGTKSVETVITRKEHKILYVRLENEYSDPEVYILENIDTEEVVKQFLIVEENIQLNYPIDNLDFINVYELRKGLHKFFVFELKNINEFNINHISIREFSNTKPQYNNVNVDTNEIDIYKKYARVPKPDLDKIYTEGELLSMHPMKQLRYLLINKYNIKNRICNKLSIEKQVEYILLSQEGKVHNPLSLISNNNVENKIIDEDGSENNITILFQSSDDPQIK
jgi:hypothetical protein